MTTSLIQKQVDEFLPLLTSKQQELVLDLIKGFLNMDDDSEGVDIKTYNKELDEAVARIEAGAFVSHEEAI